MTIMQTARLLGKNYLQVYNIVARGRIVAEQDNSGHWALAVDSVIEYCDRYGVKSEYSVPQQTDSDLDSPMQQLKSSMSHE
jgi:hypothetical protein